MIRGIVVGRDTDRLIVEATSMEVAKFGVGHEVALGHAKQPYGLDDLMKCGALYNEHGAIVLRIRELRYEASLNSLSQIHVSGFLERDRP